MNKLFDEKNSRTALTYGEEMVNKIKNLSILIFGMRGLGVEIAKNIILCSPQNVYIFDKEEVKLNDLGSNFYLNKDSIKKNRDEAVLSALQELNKDVNVKILDNFTNLENFDFDIYICTEIIDFNKIKKIEEIVNSSNKKGFIYCGVMGLCGFIFENFGNNFVVKNENGEAPKTYFIENITKSKNTEIKIDITNEEIELKKNDEIEISEVKGMIEINGKKGKILNIEDDIITIDLNSENFNKYERQGKIKEIKKEKTFNFTSFLDNLKKKLIFPINYYSKDELNKILMTILFIYSLNEFYYDNKKLPPLLNEFGARNLTLRSKAMYLFYKNKEPFNKISYFDEELIFKMSKIATCEISPLCSYFGGIVAQEALKIVGNYKPIFQWYVENFMENEIPKLEIKQNIEDSRYCEQIAIFGEEFQKKLENLKIFLIGAGALGCEYLKNFAMMGISTNKGLITVTDNDRIEISNLNRQFLFKEKDKFNYKSLIACKSVKKMNEKINCNHLKILVDKNSENKQFNELFWKNQDFIFSAVDSGKAREYIDSQCENFKKILIDAGTMGLKAKSNIVLPSYSKTLNERNFLNDDDSKKIPYCTLKFYPSRIEHCIEWAKEKFLTYFNYDMENLKKLCKNFEEEFKKLKDEPFSKDKFNKVETIYNNMKIFIKSDIYFCQVKAIKEYNKIFNLEINELITQNKKDDKSKDGSYFWNGERKLPKCIHFSTEEKDIKFIIYFSKFISHCLCVENNNNNIDLKRFHDLLNKKEECTNEQCEKYLNYIKENINIINIEKIKKKDFSKDDDDIIEFIMTAANLRAENYSIEKCDKLKTISVSGSIIPAVPTTSTSITGFNMLQFCKMIYLKNKEKIYEINLNLDSSYIYKYKIPKTEEKKICNII